jgi:hypothetical protein
VRRNRVPKGMRLAFIDLLCCSVDVGGGSIRCYFVLEGIAILFVGVAGGCWRRFRLGRYCLFPT